MNGWFAVSGLSPTSVLGSAETPTTVCRRPAAHAKVSRLPMRFHATARPRFTVVAPSAPAPPVINAVRPARPRRRPSRLQNRSTPTRRSAWHRPRRHACSIAHYCSSAWPVQVAGGSVSWWLRRRFGPRGLNLCRRRLSAPLALFRSMLCVVCDPDPLFGERAARFLAVCLRDRREVVFGRCLPRDVTGSVARRVEAGAWRKPVCRFPEG